MKSKIIGGLVFVGVLAGVASAASQPGGNYTLTFERDGWSVSKTIPVTFMIPGDASIYEEFYETGYKTARVFLEEVESPEPDVHSFTWYVTAPLALVDDRYELLGGTGPLTITVSGLAFDHHTDVVFHPEVTHIYYVGWNGADYLPKDIPGSIPVDPGETLVQRSPLRPLDPTEADYDPSNPDNPFYGTPYEDFSGPDVTFVLPDMYVPGSDGGRVWELSFGAGFALLPEPTTFLFVGLGLVPLVRRCRRRRDRSY